MIMRFMNEFDISEAARRWGDHPVLGPAVCTLQSVYDAANRCSDGWAYWPKPARAAARLMELIERDGTAHFIFDSERADATVAELKAAYRPLKSFRTRYPQCDFRIYGPGGDPGADDEERRQGDDLEAGARRAMDVLSAIAAEDGGYSDAWLAGFAAQIGRTLRPATRNVKR
jgi:hypothetical protein